MNKTSYNKIAHEWAKTRDNSFVSNLIIDFAKKVNSKGHILDIGCGTGSPIARYLCEKDFHVTGIDVSETMIEIAQSNNLSNASFIVCDFFDFTSSRKFDGVLAWDSFFHFPKANQEHIYFKVEALLNPGGYLLFTHGNADNEHIDKILGEPFYYSCLPKDKVCQILIDIGFKIEYAYEDFYENDTHRSLVILAVKK